MVKIEIDHLPSQSEIDAYTNVDLVCVYDKTRPQQDTVDSSKVLYPITHQFVVKTETRNVLYPVTERYIVKTDENGENKQLHPITSLFVSMEAPVK